MLSLQRDVCFLLNKIICCERLDPLGARESVKETMSMGPKQGSLPSPGLQCLLLRLECDHDCAVYCNPVKSVIVNAVQ